MAPRTPLESVLATLDAIVAGKPAYREIADRFRPLFEARAQVRQDLDERELHTPPVDPVRLGQGAHLLAGVDPAVWADALADSAATILPVLEQSFDLDGLPTRLLAASREDDRLLAGLARARLEGDAQLLENTSASLQSPTATLAFALENVLAPVLGAVAARVGESLSPGTISPNTTCPVCGSLPTLSHLSQKDFTELEHLVGGGGRKFLRCGLCGHDWRVRRDACPSCGEADPENRKILFAEGARRERVEVCSKCNTYCLCVDLREYDPAPSLDVLPLGLMHLDLIARKNELSPVAPTIWNTLDD